ncbi:putative nuclease HARBI1 [Chionoecetes opilio]|uniref:Putative nuclease HARBI1 n=1 Tax=Chionoecetes opilio TaxID=41210 RepID=A0A8J5CGG3_CHIOP|nr:putative nuclease HARBI1 [Chionoecetes opilio]
MAAVMVYLNFEELRCEKNDWFSYLRMDEDSYRQLLSLVSPMIKKEDTCMRTAISPHERLTATLRFVATGCSYESLKFSTCISPQALGRIIPETCIAIRRALQADYMKFPKTEDDWRKVSEEFNATWNFPNLLGAVNGKHVNIVPPANSGSYFYNYKGRHSLVLIAIVNAKHEFLMCDIGVNGQVSEGGVLQDSQFYEKLCADQLHIPPPTKTKNSHVALPYVFVGDEAFTLRKNFLKPFSQEELNHERMMFNYRLSCAMQVVENVFKILEARFRIFKSPINMKLENIKGVVMACCFLHNYLLQTRGDTYTSGEEAVDPSYSSEQGIIPLLSLQRTYQEHIEDEALEARELFQQYFNTVAAKDCQDHEKLY